MAVDARDVTEEDIRICLEQYGNPGLDMSRSVELMQSGVLPLCCLLLASQGACLPGRFRKGLTSPPRAILPEGITAVLAVIPTENYLII